MTHPIHASRIAGNDLSLNAIETSVEGLTMPEEVPPDATALRASAVALSLPDPVVVISGAGEVLWGNLAAERFFGVPLTEAVGMNAIDLVHPDDLLLVAQAVASVQQKDAGSLIEVRVRADGEWRLAEIRGAPSANEIVLCIRDITDRRRWEIAGDETARFRALVQYAAAVTLLLDGQGMVIASSGGLTRLLGHDQEQIEGRPLTALVAAADRETIAAVLRDFANGSTAGATRTIEVRCPRFDGTTIPMAFTLTNLLDDPTVEGVIAAGVDITDRIATEDELRGSNSLLTATLESTADAILVVDLHGHIVSWNGRFVEMWRLPTDVLAAGDNAIALSMVADELLDPGKFIDKIRELYATPETSSHDLLEFKDGRVFERDSRPQRLGDDIVGRVWSFRDITVHHRLEQQLQHQALHDPLTELANQTLFRDRVSHGIMRLARTRNRVATMFVDIDNFKTINDTLGHWAGDEVLTTLARRLRHNLRSSDTIARLGGDEFAVLVEDIDSEIDAAKVAEHIVETVREPMRVAGREVSLTASVGVALGGQKADVDELLRNADLAMYEAKRSGKNRTHVYTPTLHEAALAQFNRETTMKAAIGNGEFVMHYQPIYDLTTRQVDRLEALARWRQPGGVLLSPAAFVPFAEQHGLIEDLGRHLLTLAVEQISAYNAVAHTSLGVAVNLSSRQLRDPQLRHRVETVLNDSNFAPELLTLEITESALVDDPEHANRMLTRLRDLGVQLALDDFGTGYSSLAQLRHYPFHFLKIDQSFTQHIHDETTQHIVRTIVQLAQNLNLTPVAEGIESELQATNLLALGCERGQGHWLCAPMDLDELDLRTNVNVATRT